MSFHQVAPKIDHTYSKIWVNRDWVIRFLAIFGDVFKALSCKTKYRKYLAKYPFPGIHICVTYFQYCNNEPDIPKSSIKQLWNLDTRYTSISPRPAIESYTCFHVVHINGNCLCIKGVIPGKREALLWNLFVLHLSPILWIWQRLHPMHILPTFENIAV